MSPGMKSGILYVYMYVYYREYGN